MRSRITRLSLLIAATLLVIPVSPVLAQRLTCMPPGETNAAGQCLMKVPKDSVRQRITLRLTHPTLPVKDVDVNFEIRQGAGGITDKSKAGETGLVEAVWTGAATTEGTIIVARASLGGQRIASEVRLEAGAAPSPPLAVRFLSGNQQIWYEKRQLPQPVVVEVEGADASCTGAVVFFRPSAGGQASPDSAHAARETDPLTQRSVCAARTFWKLGEGVGTQHLTTGVRGQAGRTTAMARARLLPRIGAGLASSRFRSYDVAKVDSVVDPVTGSMVRDTTVEEIKGDFLLRPTITADFPVFRRIPGIRGVVGLSVVSPDRDWYIGFSALQPFYGIAHEAMGVDVNVVAHLGRRNVLEDSGDCRAGISCESDEKLLFLGAGVMFVVDTKDVLNTLKSAVAP